MTVLAIRDLTIRLGGRALLEGAGLQVDDGRKIGLIGRNGAGKSTLLRAIIGELPPDGGEIRLSARARMGHVAQEAPAGAASLLEAVLAADEERAALLAEAESASDPARVAEIHERLIAIRADSAPARAAAPSALSGAGAAPSAVAWLAGTSTASMRVPSAAGTQNWRAPKRSSSSARARSIEATPSIGARAA